MFRKILGLLSLVVFLCTFNSIILVAQDDFALPPPPDADESFAAPADLGDLPPPPAEESASELPPPPAEESASELPPPPAEESASELPPPPAEESASELPPPPAEESASELPPPPAEESASELPPPVEEFAEESAPPPPVEEEEEAPKPSAAKYNVVRGDSLWKISGKKNIYANSFKWPLIYKANKSIIEDPDLIYPRQSFKIKKDYSRDEIEDAIQKAKETPPYEPHSTPRKKLPIKY